MVRKKLNLGNAMWATLLALPLVPNAAFGRDVDPLLTADELRASTKGFEAAVEGAEPSARVRLFGLVFKSCLDTAPNFAIANSKSDASIRNGGQVGFEFRDPEGHFRDCMATKQNTTCSRNESSPDFCVSLSNLPNSSLDLANLGDVTVHLHHHRPNADRNGDVWANLDREIRQRSAATIARDRAESDARARTASVERLTQVIRNCRHDSAEIATARSALSSLASMNTLTEENFNRLNTELDRKEMELLRNRASRGTIDDLALVEEEALAIATDRCERSDEAAVVLFQVATRYARQENVGAERFNAASETLRRASELGCLSDANKARLAGHRRDLSIGRCSAVAENGLSGNMLLGPCMASLLGDLQNQAMRACSGRGASLEGCSQAMTALRSGAQIPQRAQQVEQQRAQMMAQIQQAMSGASQNGAGMPMLPGSTPAPFNFSAVPGSSPVAGAMSSPAAMSYAGGMYGLP